MKGRGRPRNERACVCVEEGAGPSEIGCGGRRRRATRWAYTEGVLVEVLYQAGGCGYSRDAAHLSRGLHRLESEADRLHVRLHLIPEGGGGRARQGIGGGGGGGA
jgi:hypothetical protein